MSACVAKEFQTVDELFSSDMESFLAAGDRCIRVMFDAVSDGIANDLFAVLPAVKEYTEDDADAALIDDQDGLPGDCTPVTWSDHFITELGKKLLDQPTIADGSAYPSSTKRRSGSGDDDDFSSLLVSNFSKLYRWVCDARINAEGFLERSCPDQPLCLVR